MKGIKNWFTYRRQIACSFSALIIVLMLLFFYFLFRSFLTENEKRFSEQSEQFSAVYMEEIADLFSVCLEKLHCVDDEPLLQEYLRSENNGLTQLIDMRYYLDALYNSLTLGETDLTIHIYRFQKNEFPISFVQKMEQLDSSLVEACLDQQFGEILAIYHAQTDSLGFYKLNRRLDGTALAITEVLLPVKRLRAFFPKELDNPDFTAVLITGDGHSIPLNQAEPPSELQVFFNGKACQNTLVIKNDLQKAGRVFRYSERTLLPFQAPDHPPEQSLYASVAFFFSSAPIYRNLWTMVLFLILFSVLTFLIINRMSRIITRKLDCIVERIQSIYLPSPFPASAAPKGDEFAIISDKITEMLDEIHRQAETEKSISLEKKELETQLLQELINPHFLYNTLDSIKWLSESPKISAAIDSIVDYYRMLLSKGKLFVPLETELHIVREYVKIQRFAYESQFRYREEIEEGLRDCMVMKHILQPFVENSLLHGIDKTGANGEIVLKAWQNGDKVHFEISDNGYGAEQSRVDQALEGAGLEGRGGYGMLNVKKRLWNVYGNRASLQIQTAPGEGTRVRISLPLWKNDQPQ